MPVEFDATESGFADGLGGASNAVDSDEYHYVLFGKQVDDQTRADGVYFEHDDQINGGVNRVAQIIVAAENVTFLLHGGATIVVKRKMEEPQWRAFLSGLDDAFGSALVRRA